MRNKAIFCPNHHCPLEFKKLSDGKGNCIISGAEFDFKAKTESYKLDLNGNIIKEYNVVGED